MNFVTNIFKKYSHKDGDKNETERLAAFPNTAETCTEPSQPGQRSSKPRVSVLESFDPLYNQEAQDSDYEEATEDFYPKNEVVAKTNLCDSISEEQPPFQEYREQVLKRPRIDAIKRLHGVEKLLDISSSSSLNDSVEDYKSIENSKINDSLENSPSNDNEIPALSAAEVIEILDDTVELDSSRTDLNVVDLVKSRESSGFVSAGVLVVDSSDISINECSANSSGINQNTTFEVPDSDREDSKTNIACKETELNRTIKLQSDESFAKDSVCFVDSSADIEASCENTTHQISLSPQVNGACDNTSVVTLTDDSVIILDKSNPLVESLHESFESSKAPQCENSASDLNVSNANSAVKFIVKELDVSELEDKCSKDLPAISLNSTFEVNSSLNELNNTLDTSEHKNKDTGFPSSILREISCETAEFEAIELALNSSDKNNFNVNTEVLDLTEKDTTLCVETQCINSTCVELGKEVNTSQPNIDISKPLNTLHIDNFEEKVNSSLEINNESPTNQSSSFENKNITDNVVNHSDYVKSSVCGVQSQEISGKQVSDQSKEESQCITKEPVPLDEVPINNIISTADLNETTLEQGQKVSDQSKEKSQCTTKEPVPFDEVTINNSISTADLNETTLEQDQKVSDQSKEESQCTTKEPVPFDEVTINNIISTADLNETTLKQDHKEIENISSVELNVPHKIREVDASKQTRKSIATANPSLKSQEATGIESSLNILPRKSLGTLECNSSNKVPLTSFVVENTHEKTLSNIGNKTIKDCENQTIKNCENQGKYCRADNNIEHIGSSVLPNISNIGSLCIKNATICQEEKGDTTFSSPVQGNLNTSGKSFAPKLSEDIQLVTVPHNISTDIKVVDYCEDELMSQTIAQENGKINTSGNLESINAINQVWKSSEFSVDNSKCSDLDANRNKVGPFIPHSDGDRHSTSKSFLKHRSPSKSPKPSPKNNRSTYVIDSSFEDNNNSLDISEKEITRSKELKFNMADIADKVSSQQQEISDLKLQLNASQQTIASLELQIRQKEEIIIKTQAEALKKEQGYGHEVKALKEQLAEKSLLIDKDSTSEMAQQVEKLKAREAKLLSELNARNNDHLNYKKIMDEYEQTISERFADYQKLKDEHETATKHLANLEFSFSDVHSKYERSKAIIEGYKANEATLRHNLEVAEQTTRHHEEKYESLKAHAKAQIDKSNKEIIQMRDRYEGEVNKLHAIIKRLEIKVGALEVSLEQKVQECTALSALCDEVTGKRV